MRNAVTNIFISYSRKDSKALALRLRDDLQATGFSVWLDLSEISGGANWTQDIQNAIEHCDVAIMLLSPGERESHWCLSEQLHAIEKAKHIVPLMAVPIDVPMHLRPFNFLNFTDNAKYDEMFRDLRSDINAEFAFRQRNKPTIPGGKSPYRQSKMRTRPGDTDEKRTAPAFRRALDELHSEDWGARFWWPSFLFTFADIQQTAEILQADEILSRFGQGEDFNTRWDKFVRLYFRPRTPDLFHAEGFRPAVQTVPGNYAAIPVVLLFDMEDVICQKDSSFAEGDPVLTKNTYKTPRHFNDLPFEEIYHDSWFTLDRREEIMRCREAQVLVPDRLGLESLQVIWLRSSAEYETLRTLLPAEIWRKWRDKITARRDYHLFNNKRPYVQQGILQADHIMLRFNPCQIAEDCEPFAARMTVQVEDQPLLTWEEDRFSPTDDLLLPLPQPTDRYDVQFYLDDELAYAGEFRGELRIL